MHRLIAPAVFALAVAVAAPALAQPAAPVSVTIGPQLQKKAEVYGQRELTDLTKNLGDAVQAALVHNGARPARVNLVIEDVTPNRPTPAQLGRHFDLSPNSVSLGGARVSGYVEGADGTRSPLRFSWYETNLGNEVGAITWSDADKAFSNLADRIAKGDIPHQYAQAASSSGDFGSRFQ